MPTKFTFIKVQYRFVDGHHMFTSDDIDGLLVVSKDAETAYRDVAPSIKLLLKMNEGIDCEVEPAMSFHDFLACSGQEEEDVTEPPPLVLSDREYCLMPA